MKVVAAILEKDGKILLARKKEGARFAGLWEFPGGKIEPGESPEECLQREMKEEFGVDVEAGRVIATSEHRFDSTVIELVALAARHLRGEFTLTDHDLMAWVEPAKLLEYPMAPADVPIARKLAAAA